MIRKLAVGALVVLGAALTIPAISAPQKALYCYQAGAGGGEGDRFPIPRENPANAGWLREHQLFNRCMGLNWELLYSPNLDNAFADPRSQHVVLGQPLLRAAERRGPVAVGMGMGFIMAHEFAHAFQFKTTGNQMSRIGRTPVVELQADILGAYWAGARLADQRREIGAPREWLNVNAGESLRQARSLGDFAFDSENHHGTPVQRGAAARAGMDAGISQRFGAVEDAFSDNADELFEWSKEKAAEIFEN